MTGKPNQTSRTVVLTPLGAWHAARIRLLARLGQHCKVAK